MCHRFGRIKKLLAYNYIERRMCLVIDYLLVLSRSTVFQNRSLHILEIYLSDRIGMWIDMY